MSLVACNRNQPKCSYFKDEYCMSNEMSHKGICEYERLNKELQNKEMKKLKIEFDEEEIYFLYEAIVNNIEDLAHKPERNSPKSGKYQYKWDILIKLREKLYNLIDWEKPSNSKECIERVD